MSNSIWNQYFANEFTGIDGLTSSLEQDKGVNRAVNYEMAVGNSLRGRVGCQTAGSYGFFAIFPYRYTRTQDQYDILYQTAAGTYPTQTASLATTKTTADGASIEKIIALNQQVWVLDTMNITITQTNAGTYTWYSAVDGSDIDFNILKNGVSILSSAMGDGVTSSTSIYSLLGTIDGLADLAVSRTTRGTCPPYAIINGNQSSASTSTTSYANTYTWTVSAHNFSAGDIITWNNSTNNVLMGGFVLSTTATTIVYAGQQGTATDGQILGYMSQAATSFPISTISSETSGVLTISFPYWRLIPEGDKSFGNIYISAFTQWADRTSGSFYAPATSVNDSGNLYIAASGRSVDAFSTCANNLVRMDGLQPSRAGLPAPTITATETGVGALSAGTRKYKCFMRRYDAQGNIFDGPVSDVYTITNNNNVYNIVAPIGPVYSDATGFQVRGCYKHTTESPAAGAAFYVDDSIGGVGNQAFVQPGDIICLTDNTTQKAGLYFDYGTLEVLGTLHVTRCTAYSAQAATISPTVSSIRVADSSGYTINASTGITTGLTMVVLRTAVGGNQYYVLCEYPYNGFSGDTFADEVSDTVLSAGEQFIEPEIGKELNAPPACTLVCQHQGGLVVARGPTTPNTVAFSTATSIEGFPTASNSFDVPSTQSGFITAIASDSDDRLSVFKERAYYDVYGDLDGGSFSINVRNEGDYGITSQASLVRLPFGLCGLSKNGWVIVSDGLLDPFRFQELNARIINQAYQFAWATAVNDYFNRQYICTIPQVTGEPVGFTIDYSRPRVKTFERSYATQIDQAGGCAMLGDTLYHLSATSPYGVFRRLVRFDGNSPSGNGDGDSFIDNTGAISYILESQPINFNEPGQLKTPIRIRVWSLPNDYVEEGWVPFSLQVDTGASPIAAYVGSGFNNGTTGTMTFSTANDVFKDHKLVNCKTHFYIVRFTTNTIRTSPFITGYEILFKNNYAKEDLVK